MEKDLKDGYGNDYAFAAAICRDKAEGGDGTRYFGSTMGWNRHRNFAISIGWLSANGALTTLGEKIGKACCDIEQNRAYFFVDEYVKVVSEVLKWCK